MKLLGDWNWYLPSWLGWLPRIGGEPATGPASAPATSRAPSLPITPIVWSPPFSTGTPETLVVNAAKPPRDHHGPEDRGCPSPWRPQRVVTAKGAGKVSEAPDAGGEALHDAGSCMAGVSLVAGAGQDGRVADDRASDG